MGRRVRVLMWDKMAKEYEPKIFTNQILSVDRLYVQRCNMQYFKKEDNVIPIELYCWTNTTITFLGQHLNKLIDTQKSIRESTIKECADMLEQTISLKGFIRVTFKLVTTEHSSYGSGAIVDKDYRLRVNIKNFNENSDLKCGTPVKIIGTIKQDKGDAIYLQVEKTEDVVILHGSLPLPDKDLKKGVKPPRKRTLSEEENKENVKEKKKLNLNDSGVFDSVTMFDSDNELSK